MNKICNMLQWSLVTPIVARRIAPRLMCSKGRDLGAQGTNPISSAHIQKKQQTSPKISLLGHNQSISIMSLEEAQKLAKRRDLQLLQVKEIDTKTKRPVYKLVTAAEMLTEEFVEPTGEDRSNVTDKDKSNQKKSEKSLTINSRIAEHDLSSRLKNITKWLSKNHGVRLIIQCSNTADIQNGEKIVKNIEESLKTPEIIGKIVQKRTTGAVIKFSIVPVLPAPSTTNTTTQA